MNSIIDPITPDAPTPPLANPFTIQIEKTLKWEGGYSFDPNDPGGETNFGISKRSYPNLDIKNLTRTSAIEIYYRHYWLEPQINRLPALISGKVFDAGVNIGSKTAIILLQDILNDWQPPTIDTDGIIGTHTISATMRACQIYNGVVLSTYKNALIAHYQSLVKQHAGLARYLQGWINRANA